TWRYVSVRSGRATKYQRDLASKETGWRAVPPALAVNRCGCFLPDLTRFTTVQCGGARRWVVGRARLGRLHNAPLLCPLSPPPASITCCPNKNFAGIVRDTIFLTPR